jgi:hypothetical protein
MPTRQEARSPRPLLPRALRSAAPSAKQAAADLTHIARRIDDLEGDLAELVVVARGEGLSWDVIGYSVGTSGSAARKRWGDLVDMVDDAVDQALGGGL